MDGRQRRFGVVFEACFVPVTAYTRRRVGPSDADDVVAEVFTVAWRRLDDIPEGVELPWLYGVARRTIANQRRTLTRRTRLLERIAAQPSSLPAPVGTDHEGLRRALSHLREPDREILRLAAWEDLDAHGIAVVLGCSPNAAALRLSRARRRLRNAMTPRPPIRTQTTVKDSDG